MVEGHVVGNCAPTLARLLPHSLPGMSVWEGDHIVSTFQLFLVRVWAIARALQVNW
jgi:hypothetical protein